jgi:hypothetical protein
MKSNVFTKMMEIGNVGFNVFRTACDAPRFMWPRELMRNCIEATEYYIKNHSNITLPLEIKIRAIPLKWLDDYTEFTAPKVSMLNYGGMTKVELGKACRMFSSVNKTMGNDDNFGVGAKATCLTWTDLMFITRKNGKSHMVKLGLNREKNIIGCSEIIDFSAWVEYMAELREYPIGHDFTEVILLGRDGDIKQNTFHYPYGSDMNKEPSNGLITSIYRRFVTIPENIILRFDSGTKINGGLITHNASASSYSDGIIFNTWVQCWDRAKNDDCIYELVEDSSTGIKYHYYYDAPNLVPSSKNRAGEPLSAGKSARMTSVGFSGIIFGKVGEQEYFDVLHGSAKKRMFNKLGIFSGNEYFKIFVELPYVGYRMSNYRDVLTEETDYDRVPIMFNNYIHGIRDNMPTSIKQKISEHNIGVTTSDVEELLRDELKKFEYDSILANGTKVPGANGGGGKGSLRSESVPDPDREIKKRNKNLNPVPRSVQVGNTAGMVTVSNSLPIFQIYDHNLVIENEMDLSLIHI